MASSFRASARGRSREQSPARPAIFSTPRMVTIWRDSIRGTAEVVVERVDNRIPASRPAFEKEKESLRQQALASFRRQRVTDFLANLKAVAKINDRRKQVETSSRSTTTQ